MTDLFAGGEDTSFTLTGFTLQTAGGGPNYRTAFARGMLQATAGAVSTADPPAKLILSRPWPATGTVWVHARCYQQNTASSTLNATLLRVLDGSGIARIVVRGTATSGQVKISSRNAAGTFVDLVTSASGAFPAKTTPTSVNLFVNYAVAGQATLYIDGVNVADTGPGVDITTNGVTTLAQADFAELVAQTSWSEIIVRDSSTLGASLLTLPPVASGNTQSWTPNTVGNINEAVINDANSITTTSANALSEWTASTALPTGAWTISSIVQEARISRGATGPQNFEWLVRTTDGTDHVTGTVNPTTSLSNFANIWATNPHTGAAWGAGELINAGVESLA